MSEKVGLNDVIKPPVKLPKVKSTSETALKASEKALKTLSKTNKNTSSKVANTNLKNASKNLNKAVKLSNKASNDLKKNNKKAQNGVIKAMNKVKNSAKNVKNNASDKNINSLNNANNNLNNLNKELASKLNEAKSIENDIKKTNGNVNKANLKINYLNKVFKADGTIVNVKSNNEGQLYINNNKKKVHVTFKNNRPKTEMLPKGIPKGNKKINGVLHYNVNGKAREVFENTRGIRYVRRPGPEGNGKHYPFGTAKFFNNKQIMNNLLL